MVMVHSPEVLARISCQKEKAKKTLKGGGEGGGQAGQIIAQVPSYSGGKPSQEEAKGSET